jgi:hypothetical protein
MPLSACRSVSDPEPESLFVITAHELRGWPLLA